METTYTHGKKTIDFINKQMDKKGLNNLLSQMYLEFGGAKTAELANSLKNLGYKYATKSGTTISIADLQVPEKILPLHPLSGQGPGSFRESRPAA